MDKHNSGKNLREHSKGVCALFLFRFNANLYLQAIVIMTTKGKALRFPVCKLKTYTCKLKIYKWESVTFTQTEWICTLINKVAGDPMKPEKQQTKGVKQHDRHTKSVE